LLIAAEFPSDTSFVVFITNFFMQLVPFHTLLLGQLIHSPSNKKKPFKHLSSIFLDDGIGGGLATIVTFEDLVLSG
jgi:hypothetical protein